MPHLCFYVTGHGFGHAARVEAMLEAVLAEPGFTVEVRSAASRSLFSAPLRGKGFQVSPVQLEPGVVQLDSLHHDLGATLEAWRQHLEQTPAQIEAEAAHLRKSGAEVVVSDASPVGCAAGARAGLPALLVGNFTWDWILEPYIEEEPGFAEVIAAIRRLHRQATAYLRLPMSVPSHPSSCFAREEELPLLARHPRRGPREVRADLGVAEDEKLILLSFGGYGIKEVSLERVAAFSGTRCVWDRGPSRPPFLISVADRDLHYPDLIAAADLVLCKPGYGVFSEAIAARTPIAFVPRADFREAAVLESYLQQRWPCLRLPEGCLADASWVEPVLNFLASAPPCPPLPTDGAERVLQLIRVALCER